VDELVADLCCTRLTGRARRPTEQAVRYSWSIGGR
jgi:hypothetical protein